MGCLVVLLKQISLHGHVVVPTASAVSAASRAPPKKHKKPTEAREGSRDGENGIIVLGQGCNTRGVERAIRGCCGNAAEAGIHLEPCGMTLRPLLPTRPRDLQRSSSWQCTKRHPDNLITRCWHIAAVDILCIMKPSHPPQTFPAGQTGR